MIANDVARYDFIVRIYDIPYSHIMLGIITKVSGDGDGSSNSRVVVQ